MRPAAAFVAATMALLLVGGACATPRLDRDGARSFSVGALRSSGLGDVRPVATATVSACEVEGADGWRTVTATDVGEVSMCVSREQGRALSVRDPGMSDEQFERLEAYRGDTAQDRAMPFAIGSAALLLIGVTLRLLLERRPRDPAS